MFLRIGPSVLCLLDIENILIRRYKENAQWDRPYALLQSGQKGYIKIANYLINNYYGGEITRHTLTQSLVLASENKHNSFVQRFIKYGDKEYIFFKACETNNLPIVQLLKDEDINYGLIIACRYGNLSIVKYLISLGAEKEHQHNSSLKVASYNGHLYVVKYLISLYPQGQKAISKSLIEAASNDQIRIVKYLIPLNVRYNTQKLVDAAKEYFEDQEVHTFLSGHNINKESKRFANSYILKCKFHNL